MRLRIAAIVVQCRTTTRRSNTKRLYIVASREMLCSMLRIAGGLIPMPMLSKSPAPFTNP
jgi:hypothetical protein